MGLRFPSDSITWNCKLPCYMPSSVGLRSPSVSTTWNCTLLILVRPGRGPRPHILPPPLSRLLSRALRQHCLGEAFSPSRAEAVPRKCKKKCKAQFKQASIHKKRKAKFKQASKHEKTQTANAKQMQHKKSKEQQKKRQSVALRFLSRKH